jgi:hypothetical protein
LLKDGDHTRRTGWSEGEEAEYAVHTVGSRDEYVEGSPTIAHDSYVSTELMATQYLAMMAQITPAWALG